MKKLDEGRRITAANAWGKYTTCTHTHYKIELEDVGNVLDNHQGYNRNKCITFTNKDVGRTIDIVTDGSGWTCWSFIN